jgi:hypothetical protein
VSDFLRGLLRIIHRNISWVDHNITSFLYTENHIFWLFILDEKLWGVCVWIGILIQVTVDEENDSIKYRIRSFNNRNECNLLYSFSENILFDELTKRR